MQFNSINFMIFFPVVLTIYFIIPRKMRSVWLLMASYYFYMSWNAMYAILIGSSTLITYICGIVIDRVRKKSCSNLKLINKFVMITCIIVNLGILAVFKVSAQ